MSKRQSIAVILLFCLFIFGFGIAQIVLQIGRAHV